MVLQCISTVVITARSRITLSTGAGFIRITVMVILLCIINKDSNWSLNTIKHGGIIQIK